ncbi:MAG: hypothetical protein AB7T49_14735 [Oligoflexales bacterium]
MISDEEKQRHDLIRFVSKYSALLETQLVAVRQTMENTVTEIMDSVTKISDTLETKRKEAENLLEATYLAPDQATKNIVDNVQNMVSDIFDEASRKFADTGSVTAAGLTPKQTEQQIEMNLSMASSLMTKDKTMEAIDSNMQEIIMNMIGSLSSEDVIAQRMDHVIHSLQGLHISLGYILLDYVHRSRTERVSVIMQDLKDYTLRQYTMEDEKHEFFTYFEDDKASKKAS